MNKLIRVNADYIVNSVKAAIEDNKDVLGDIADIEVNECYFLDEFLAEAANDDFMFESVVNMLEDAGIIEYNKAAKDAFYNLHDYEVQEKPSKKQLMEVQCELLREQAKTNHYLRVLLADKKQ